MFTFTVQTVVSGFSAIVGICVILYLSKILHRSECLTIHAFSSTGLNIANSVLTFLLRPGFTIQINSFLLITTGQEFLPKTVVGAGTVIMVGLIGANLPLHMVKTVEQYRIFMECNENASRRWKILWVIPIIVFFVTSVLADFSQVHRTFDDEKNGVAIGFGNRNMIGLAVLLLFLVTTLILCFVVVRIVWAGVRRAGTINISYQKRVKLAFTLAACMETMVVAIVLYIPFTVSIVFSMVGFETVWTELVLSVVYVASPVLEMAASTIILQIRSGLPPSIIHPSHTVSTVSTVEIQLQNRRPILRN